MDKSKYKSLGTSYWYVTLVVVILAGAAAVTYAIITTSNSIKASLIQRTDSMAELIAPDSIAKLNGDESDLQLPEYQELKDDLMAIRESNRDIRFIYILGLRNSGNEAYFAIDSEWPGSEGYSPPGQAYPEGLKDVRDIYEQKTSRVLPIERDRWGIWLSAFSPIFDADKEHVVGAFGMDVPAGYYYRQIAITAAVPLLLTLTVVMGLIFARNRAMQQQRYLNEKAFYLSFASHEIVSPLTSMSWAIRYQRDQPDILAKVEGTIGEILTTVNDVLSLQNLDRLSAKKLDKEPEQISALIDTLITNLSIVCDQHGVRIENKTAESNKAFTAQVDRLLFKRVLFNLLINAVKYSPKGGVVTALVEPAGTQWTVSVHNDGEGLSPEDQQRIFEGFYRTKSAESAPKQGTGLGLMLSRSIIARHGGAITVESAPNQGVTFKITMPIA